VPPLSVTIITLNEAAHLAAAIASVAWADEIVVVDAGSTDGTADLARQLATRVEVREWPGFAAQKNHAASLARHDWILSLDADERVGPALGASLDAWRTRVPSAHGYRIARTSWYLGEWIRTTDWYPDYQLRLYDRRAARWGGTYVHEGVEVHGRVGRLRQELQHLPYRDMSHHLRTIDRYTTLAARQMHEAGRRVTAPALVLRPAGAFLRNYLLRGGWRDGSVGLVVSALNSYYVFLKFAKLWELRREKDAEHTERRPSGVE
jgi:glycosyltransferase involved in cell wall biosynthesis